MEPHRQLSYEKCVFEELSGVNSSSSPFLMLFFVVYAGMVEGKPSQTVFTLL